MKLVRELGNERGQWWFTIEGKDDSELALVQLTEKILSSTKLGFYHNEGGNVNTIWGHFGDGCQDYSGSTCISGGFHMPMSMGDSFKEAYKAAKKQALSELR